MQNTLKITPIDNTINIKYLDTDITFVQSIKHKNLKKLLSSKLNCQNVKTLEELTDLIILSSQCETTMELQLNNKLLSPSSNKLYANFKDGAYSVKYLNITHEYILKGGEDYLELTEKILNSSNNDIVYPVMRFIFSCMEFKTAGEITIQDKFL